MGKITPLHDLDYKTVEPLRIYKFSPKYFLTMGESTLLRYTRFAKNMERSPENRHQRYYPHRQHVPRANKSTPGHHSSVPWRPRLPRLRTRHAQRALRIPSSIIPPAPLPYHLPSRLLSAHRKKPNHERKPPSHRPRRPPPNPPPDQPQRRRGLPHAPPLPRP